MGGGVLRSNASRVFWRLRAERFDSVGAICFILLYVHAVDFDNRFSCENLVEFREWILLWMMTEQTTKTFVYVEVLLL